MTLLPIVTARRVALIAAAALATAVSVIAVTVTTAAAPPTERTPLVYHPDLAVPELLAPFVQDIEPGHDAFTEERDAHEIEAGLRELGGALGKAPEGGGKLLASLLAPDFRGAPLVAAVTPSTSDPFVVTRAERLPSDLSLDRRAFPRELERLVGDRRELQVAEFIVTAIERPSENGLVRTMVRYDLVGPGKEAWRIQDVGEWRMAWRRGDGGWQVVEWAPASHVRAVARTPVFTEITTQALAGNESFARQLNIGLDDWMATFDSVLTRDSNAHHGVSVGDVDGDGLEDVYVAQPSGLPNRLFRARGDGTFEDITNRSGLDVLDDTAASLLVDVDNDGDEDAVLSTGTRPLLFVNDGAGRFSPVPDAFRFARPLQGSLTSIAMADYDRDGFLDLYLCVYSYFYGAGEEKAGTPAPYYDARNGPPGVLFRNDGHGRFVDVTAETGLDEGNDRYHFAAAWADYDADGWPDLFVANDFGTKNLYRNLGRRNGKVTFEDVAARAGVLDYGAGMSATFLDYDNDGLLDIYAGNMWTASGLRVTASPAFMPGASEEVRAHYRRHARGNALFRNRGDGTFEDATLEARAAMGRWAWSSDALDFDADGWEDLYIANGMLTREPLGPELESFFWRQVVARSPLTRIKSTSYDDAWRAINQVLIRGSIASRQRNVFLRNDGHGGFDDVSGAVGLDLDQDGRAFAVTDLDRDGDPDLLVMAARQAPQLRVFRNDYAAPGATLSIRLRGTTSNRDAIGARVVVETDRVRRTKVVHAGSGFLSQHSKELIFGLGASTAIRKVTVHWPSGETRELTNVPLGARLRLVEGGELETLPAVKPAGAGARTANPAPEAGPAAPPDSTWLYEPFPAPGFSLPDVRGTTRSIEGLRGNPAVLLIWAPGAEASRDALSALAGGYGTLERAGVGAVAIAVDPSADGAGARAAASVETRNLPVVTATRELALSYAILNRHLFMNRQDLQLPTVFLLNADGSVVKAYRGRVDVAAIVRDAAAIEAPPAERLARAVPFPGTFYSPVGLRNYLPYGRELLDQGLDAAAVVAFERAARANPSAPTLYRLGTLLAKTGEVERARAAYEKAASMQPDLAEAHNDLGALFAQAGDLEGAIERFRQALASTPEYPDALNNLGYALLVTGRDQEARALYEKALALQPDFPEALNNLGLLFGRAGDLDRAETHFRRALERRPDYGEAANNLALVLVARGQPDAAEALLEGFLEKAPSFESTYVTLAKIYLSADRTAEGIAVLERLLQRNPKHPIALELLREFKPR